jgi:hypothetical protein
MSDSKFEFMADRKKLAESLLHLDGSKFSLQDYPMYTALYRGHWASTLLMCGRQVGKSVSAAAFEIVDSIAKPHFRTLYVSPSLKQTHQFSVTRVGKMLRHSPAVRDAFMRGDATDNVFLKILENGSELLFTYACDDPDRARGISADRVTYDEVQDILYDEVVPVINECLANSKYGLVSYMGTPKTMDNTIQFLWDQSTQSEWCVKCGSCGSFSFYRTPDGVGKRGLECLKCRKLVNPRQGTWVDMNPIPKDAVPGDAAYSRTKGFHVPQLVLPANTEDPLRWGKILTKLDQYSESKFKNEVLGVSDAVGSRLVSMEELYQRCQDYTFEASPTTYKTSGGTLVGGVDWSGGGTKGYSRTVGWIWRVQGSSMKCVWYRIFPSANPVEDVEELARVFKLYSVQLVIGDAGEGALANAQLKKFLGDSKVFQVQYGSSAQAPLKWNGRDRYMADRTTMIDNFLMFVKRGGTTYPRAEQSRAAFEDMLNVYEEVTQQGKKLWRHAPSQPDDALHAQIFAWIGAKILTHDLEFYA